VPRHVRPQVGDSPLRHALDLEIGIVVAGNQEGGDLEPNLGFVFDVHQRVEDWLQLAAAKLEVKVLREALW
jgi:hypothetical protein